MPTNDRAASSHKAARPAYWVDSHPTFRLLSAEELASHLPFEIDLEPADHPLYLMTLQPIFL